MAAQYYKILTAKAPVNIAVIKYWGKSNEKLKLPINDSLSGTLNLDDMCATTTVAVSSTFQEDELWLNQEKQDIESAKSHARVMLDEMRKLSKLSPKILQYKVHIVSYNNFPTAAGLASSAAGYACLAYVLGHLYGIEDSTQLSRLARMGSGSACRSLFGGFVRWHKGHNHETSIASQIVNETYWPEMKVLICVINDNKKDVSSSEGMLRSVQTSSLISYRSEKIVPGRMDKIIDAIKKKDFDSFAEITMQDSNQFHAICLDSKPPIFYLNDASRQIIKICSIINTHFGQNKVAYTFDAGPNACVYLLEDFVPQFVKLIQQYFPIKDGLGNTKKLEIRGQQNGSTDLNTDIGSLVDQLQSAGIRDLVNSVSYLISTSIGSGPKLVEDHMNDNILEPQI